MDRRWIVGLVVMVGILLVGRAVSLAQREAKVHGVMQVKSAGWAQPGQAEPVRIGADQGLPRGEPSTNAEDRMAAYDGFMSRSRKEVDESIQSLSREAVLLKARLQSVEAALVRWQAVAGALDQASGAASISPTVTEPAQLEPIPSGPALPQSSLPAAEIGPKLPSPPSPIPPPPSPVDPQALPVNPTEPTALREASL